MDAIARRDQLRLLVDGMTAANDLGLTDGTSLSKAFGLISRFSEDIDITVFRQDIGESIEAADLDALSGKQRRIRLERIRVACQQYIAEGMAVQLSASRKRDRTTDHFRRFFALVPWPVP